MPNQAKPIRVLLIDDHALVRAGIRALIGQLEEVEVAGEAAGGREALRLIEELEPDIVLMDIAAPGMSGLEVLTESAKRFPHVRLIVLAVHEAGEYALGALRAGAAGYLPKSAASNELKEAIETVARGEIYVSSDIAKKTVLEHARESQDERSLEKLTPRQREILTLMAEGNSTREIARRLKISVKTVESHRAQLMERLNIHGVAGLVRFAIRLGLIKVE